MSTTPGSTPAAGKRRYQMGARAEAAEATGQRILEVASERFLSASYDAVSLEQIADAAGVALKTVLRRFGSKEKLFLECGKLLAHVETRERVVEPGDVQGVVRVLSERYEATMDAMLRYLAVEDRVPVVAELIGRARREHHAWLAEAFAPQLPARRGALQERRLAELFGATEIYVWHGWRRRLGLGRKAAEQALGETLEALLARWASGASRG